MRATEEDAYLRSVCRIVAGECGHAMVWIGFAENGPDRRQRRTGVLRLHGGPRPAGAPAACAGLPEPVQAGAVGPPATGSRRLPDGHRERIHAHGSADSGSRPASSRQPASAARPAWTSTASAPPGRRFQLRPHKYDDAADDPRLGTASPSTLCRTLRSGPWRASLRRAAAVAFRIGQHTRRSASVRLLCGEDRGSNHLAALMR